MSTPPITRIPKLAITVIFFYREHRLVYLDTLANHFASLADQVIVTIVTNTDDAGERAIIEKTIAGRGFAYDIFTPIGLGHPWLLPWSHFYVFRKLIQDESVTHFMYVEDDILITAENITYWLESLPHLRHHGLLPGFLRVEQQATTGIWYSSDCLMPHVARCLPHVRGDKNLMYVNLPTPYQGTYLLDRELMQVHLNNHSSHPNFGQWGIPEKATQGLTYFNFPKGFRSRMVIPYNESQDQIDPRCLIHHLPNNYINRAEPSDRLASVPVAELLRAPTLKHLVRYVVDRVILAFETRITKRPLPLP